MISNMGRFFFSSERKMNVKLCRGYTSDKSHISEYFQKKHSFAQQDCQDLQEKLMNLNQCQDEVVEKNRVLSKPTHHELLKATNEFEAAKKRLEIYSKICDNLSEKSLYSIQKHSEYCHSLGYSDYYCSEKIRTPEENHYFWLNNR